MVLQQTDHGFATNSESRQPSRLGKAVLVSTNAFFGKGVVYGVGCGMLRAWYAAFGSGPHLLTIPTPVVWPHGHRSQSQLT